MNREVHVRFWESAGLRCPAPLTYLRAYDTVAEARTSLARYFSFYNSRIRALTGKHPIIHPASADRGGLNPAGAPLIRRKICSDKRSQLSGTKYPHSETAPIV